MMETAAASTYSKLRWHLAFTKPAAEEVAKAHLERQGYGVYLPRLQQRTLQRGKWRDRVTALFPRYLFVQLDSVLQSLAPIRSTTGVASIVRFGVDYAVVPDRIVTSLRASEDPDSHLHQLRVGEWLKPGAALRIGAGAMAGLQGIFVCEDANDRVTVLLYLLGREIHVRVDASSVVPAAA